jgi:hypothetical protein
MREDSFVEGKMTWFTGVIEDILDPEVLGRVRVRCFGYHTENKTLVGSEDLPWATVSMPATQAGVEGIGQMHGLLPGSWVVGLFRDGPSAQDPLILGVISSQTTELRDQTLGFTGTYPKQAGKDHPGLVAGEDMILEKDGLYNRISKSVAGHIIEIDDTIDNNRLKVTHSSGTTIEINQEGDISINSFSDVITLDGNTSITGTLSVTEDITGSKNISAGEEVSAKSTGEEDAEPVTLSGHTHKTKDPDAAVATETGTG